MKVAAGVAIALVAVWAFYEANPGAPSAARAEERATDIEIRTPAGSLKRLSELRGKVVLLDFWATWCGPCRMSIPAVQTLYDRYRAQGFEVFGVADPSDGDAEIKRFVRELGMTYPVGVPTSIDEVAPYRVGSIPYMVLIDREGRIRQRIVGYDYGVEDALEADIQKYLRGGAAGRT